MVDQHANRRRAPRFEAVFTVVSVWLETESGERHSAQMIDVSTSGARLSTNHDLGRDDRLTLILESPSLEIQESCQLLVRWVTPGKRDTTVAGCELVQPLMEETLSRLAAAGQLNRRRDERFPISIQGHLSQELSPQEGFAVRVENLSQGGLRLFAPETVELGQRLLLLLRSDGQRVIHVLVNPVWQMRVPAGYFVGCSFLQSSGYRSVADVVSIGDPSSKMAPGVAESGGPRQRRKSKPFVPLLPGQIAPKARDLPEPSQRRKGHWIGVACMLALLLVLIAIKLQDDHGTRVAANVGDPPPNAAISDESTEPPDSSAAAGGTPHDVQAPVPSADAPSGADAADGPGTRKPGLDTRPATGTGTPPGTSPTPPTTTPKHSPSGDSAPDGPRRTTEEPPSQFGDLERSVRAALRMAASRNEAATTKELDRAGSLAARVGRPECVVGTQKLAQNVREFWSEFDGLLARLEPNSTFTFRERVVTVIEVRADTLSIRYDGKSRTYDRSKLPAKLVGALADHWLDKTLPENRVRYAAFLVATYPDNGHALEQITAMWAELRELEATLPDVAGILVQPPTE